MLSIKEIWQALRVAYEAIVIGQGTNLGAAPTKAAIVFCYIIILKETP